MAFSIEARVPFLDHRLVEYGLRLAPHHKMRGGESKRVMRRALADLLPPSVTARRDKMGFGAPQQRWLRERILPAFANDMRTGNFALGALIHADALTAQLAAPTPATSKLLFQLFTLNRWALRFGVDITG